MNLLAVGILVLVAASAGSTTARINASGDATRSRFIVRKNPLLCAGPEI
jgi:hypothetical protein